MGTRESTVPARTNGSNPPTLTEFERIYRSNVGAVTAFFARRRSDPQTVADLTSETFARAIGSFGTFDRRRGSPGGWLLGIARRVYAQHCANEAANRTALARFGARLVLDDEELEELAARIDAQQVGRRLLERCARLSALEREAIELVALAGLSPREAAAVLGVSAGVVRARLFRARAALREGGFDDERRRSAHDEV